MNAAYPNQVKDISTRETVFNNLEQYQWRSKTGKVIITIMKVLLVHILLNMKYTKKKKKLDFPLLEDIILVLAVEAFFFFWLRKSVEANLLLNINNILYHNLVK